MKSISLTSLKKIWGQVFSPWYWSGQILLEKERRPPTDLGETEPQEDADGIE